MYDFGLTEHQFWNLTPAKFFAISERHDTFARQTDLRVGLVCSAIYNAAGGKKDGTPFSPDDFLPKYEGDEASPARGEMTPDQILAHMKALFPKREKGKKRPSKRTLVPKEARGG